MSNWTAAQTSVTRDPSNFNVIATVVFTSDDNPPRTYQRTVFGVDLTPDKVAEWAQTIIINVLQVSDASFAATSAANGPITLPALTAQA